MLMLSLTSEADSLPTDTWQLLEDYGLVGCHSARSHDLSVHAKIDSTGYVRLIWASIGWPNELSFAAILEVKFRQTSERALADLREQTADTLFFWPWNCCIIHSRQRPQHHWGQNLCLLQMYLGHQEKVIGDYINSSETTMVCVPFSSWASLEGTLSCSTFFCKSTQEGTTLQGWCCCWRCHCGSIQVPTEARVPIFVQFLGCRHVKRNATGGQREPPISEQTSLWLFDQ